MIAHLYKRIRTTPFEKASKLNTFDNNNIDQDSNEIGKQDFLDFENIDELYMQIEICWKTLDFEPLQYNLKQFQSLLKQKDFNFTESFFEYEIDDILFNLISNIEGTEEEESFLPNIVLQNISISIIQDLFIKYAQIFPKNSIINYISHIKPVIINWKQDIILQILNSLLILCCEHYWILEDHIDIVFFLDILDQRNNIDLETDLECNSFFYDDDQKDQISTLIKQILLKVPSSFEYLSLVFNNGSCGMKRFSIFLWFLIKDSSLIPSFDSSLYLPKIQLILEKSLDYSLLFPSIVFLSKVWNIVKNDFSILQLFQFINIIQNSKEHNSEVSSQFNSLSINSWSIVEPDATFLDEKEAFYITQISSITLYCISTFIFCGLEEALFCIDNGIIDLILKNIDSSDCQNQIKREAARCLCSLVMKIPPNPLIYPFIQQFYEDEAIIDLIFNILEYDEIDMDKLILETLIILIKAENSNSTFLLEKCLENFNLFTDLLNSEESEIAAITQQLLTICEDKFNKEE